MSRKVKVIVGITLWQNYFYTFKTQLIQHDILSSVEETEKILFKYIEVYFNQRKKHSANGWKAPAHYGQA